MPSGTPKSGSPGSGVFVGVGVIGAVEVKVTAGMAVEASVEVAVNDGVTATGADVRVAVTDDDRVAVATGKAVEVAEGFAFGVEEDAGGKYTDVFVELTIIITWVFVAAAILIGVDVW